MAALLIVSLAVWVAVSASSLGLTVGSTTPHAVATHTPAHKATNTAATTPTLTQQQLDQQAEATFRAITLGTNHDLSCSSSNARQQFDVGTSKIYVNLCASDHMGNMPFSVHVQSEGHTIVSLADNTSLGAGQNEYLYWLPNGGAPSGQYDVLISMTINGRNATAADISFTVS